MAKFSKSVVTGLVFVILIATLLIQSATVKADWTMFRHDPAHTGAEASNPVLTPTMLWNFTPTNANTTDQYQQYIAMDWSSPAIVNGVVYIGMNGYNHIHVFGHYSDRYLNIGALYLLNASTGQELRGVIYDNQAFDLSPAVVNDLIFAKTNVNTLSALNASSGLIWSFGVERSINEVFDVGSSPTVVDGKVFVGWSDGNIYALNEFNGNRIWNFTTEKTAMSNGNGVFSAPAVTKGVVYAGSNNGIIYALNETNGSKLWSYATKDEIQTAPTVVDGAVYFGSFDGSVYSLNAKNGALNWNYTTGNRIQSSPAVTNGVVYIGSNDHKIYAINATNGVLIWNFTTGDKVLSSPAFASGIVFVGSNDKNLYALNATDGSKIWNYPTSNGIQSSPAVFNGIVYFGSQDGKVYALGMPTASPSPSPSSQSKQELFSTLTIVIGLVVVVVFVIMIVSLVVFRRHRKTNNLSNAKT